MKKELMTIGAACAATLAIFAASDRIDIFDKTGNFVSLMVDDVQEVTVGKAAGEDGYSSVNVITASGTKTRAIADMGDLKYTPVDYDKANEITMSHAPNAKVVLLDWRNNTDYFGEAQIDPTKPADWRGCPPDLNPHFLIETDKGFASEFAVKGMYSGKVYTDNPNFIFWSLADMNLLGIDSYSFDMPFEPVEISVTSVELETYKGKEFLGSYTGFLLSPGSARIARKVPATLAAEFRANGTYVMKSTDDNEFDFLDLFDYDEEKNTFAYVPYSGRPVNPIDLEVKTGVTGGFAEGGLLFATFHDLLEDKPDNNVHYFAAKGECEFSVASANEYGNHLLMQAVPADGGSTRWFYVQNYGAIYTEVAMEFSFGSDIGANCTAFAVSGGEKLFKYDYKGSGYDPVFTFRGDEYGTYAGAAGALALDGFDSCTLGGADAKYAVNGGLASVTIDGDTRLFVLDREAKTYAEMVADVWNGQPQYTKTDALGAYGGMQENSGNSMRIDFDKDFAGADEPGTACVRFTVARNDGFGNGTSEMVASSGKYVYNAASKTVIITNLYMGTSATASGRRNLVLKDSDDMLSMWIDDSEEARVYGSGRDGSYLLTGAVNTMTAPAPAPAVELAPKYTATHNVLYMGSPMGTAVTTVTINADNTSTLSVMMSTTELCDQTVAYELSGNTLTLKDVSTYTLESFVPKEAKTDLVFTVGDDGALTTEQVLGCSAMGGVMDIELSSAPLVPEAGTPAVQLAPKYAATHNVLYMGGPMGTAATTLTINADNTSTLTVMMSTTALCDQTVAYELSGNTLTLKDVSTYALESFVPKESKTDLVFTVGEDGTLTSGQTLGCSAMGGVMDIALSSAPLVPAE